MSADNRTKMLGEVGEAIAKNRNTIYGEPEDSFKLIADYWETYIKHNCASAGADIAILPRDVAMLMVLFKIGRLEGAEFESYDSFIDMAGYAICGADIEYPQKFMGEDG